MAQEWISDRESGLSTYILICSPNNSCEVTNLTPILQMGRLRLRLRPIIVRKLLQVSPRYVGKLGLDLSSMSPYVTSFPLYCRGTVRERPRMPGRGQP